MKNLQQLDQLTEYRLKYNEALNTRQYLGNKMAQIITIYTASASCTVWNIFKYIKNFSKYRTLQKNIVVLFLITCSLFLLYELILYKNINHVFNRDIISSKKIKKLFDEHMTEELLNAYEEKELDENIYKILCKSYIAAAIHNDKMNKKMATKQKKLLESILFSFFIIAITFCLVTIVF